MPTVADKRQLNLYPDRSVLNRLENIASKFGRPRTQIALDIIETYMDMWALAEEAKKNVVREQQDRLREFITGKTSHVLPKAQTESSTVQGRKKAK
jgi:hypothetical protein